MRLGEAARQRRLVTVELIPDRVVQNDVHRLKGRVDAVTIPALRNGSHDPSYPTAFRVSPQQRSIASALIVRRMGVEAVATLTCRDCRRDELPGVSGSRKGSLENVLVVYGDPFPRPSRGVYEFSRSQFCRSGRPTPHPGFHTTLLGQSPVRKPPFRNPRLREGPTENGRTLF